MTRMTQLFVFFCLMFHFSYSQAYSEKLLHQFEFRNSQYSAFHADKGKNAYLILAQYNDEEKIQNQAQRQELREQRKKRFELMSPEEKRRIREARTKFKNLPSAKRKKLKDKWHNLSPQQRKNIIKKRRNK